MRRSIFSALAVFFGSGIYLDRAPEAVTGWIMLDVLLCSVSIGIAVYGPTK